MVFKSLCIESSLKNHMIALSSAIIWFSGFLYEREHRILLLN